MNGVSHRPPPPSKPTKLNSILFLVGTKFQVSETMDLSLSSATDELCDAALISRFRYFSLAESRWSLTGKQRWT